MRTVLYRDDATGKVGRVVDIEVPPGSRRIQMAGYDEEVWHLPREERGSLLDDPSRRIEYDTVIGEFRRLFAPYYPLNQAQWWEVIEGDRNPVKSYERWCQAAEVFHAAMKDKYLQTKGYEVFELLSTLVRLSSAELPRRFTSNRLPPETIQELVDFFHHGPPIVVAGANCSTDHG